MKCYITEHLPIRNMAKYIVIEKVSPVLCTTERSVPQYSTCITPSLVTQNSQYLVSMFLYWCVVDDTLLLYMYTNV